MKTITCVVPCYNESKSLEYFYKEILVIMEQFKTKFNVVLEVLFINDGSSDNTLEVMKNFASQNEQVNYISFSRNFGKESAIFAGLEHAKGDYVAILDADMQDPPSLLPKMYESLQIEDIDQVATRRVTRTGEPPIRSLFARLFYKIINKISDVDIVDGARDFRLMKREVVDAIISMHEYNRFSKGIFGWVGFKTTWIAYENVERVAGETKWSFWKLFKYSIEGIVAFSTVPLTLIALIGVIVCILSLLYTGYVMVDTLLYDNPVDGWPSLICLVSFIGGLQLFSIGVVGQYISKIYLETKKRPIYVIREKS